MSKNRILFLAADPTDSTRLRLGQELRVVKEKLQLSKLRDDFLLDSRESVRAEDITQAILDFEPQIVHFSGHGMVTGELCFEDILGKIQPVSPIALANLFELVAKQVDCVVLNACHSEIQAKAIAEHIPFVVGMNQAIGDRAAITFATGFYKALGAGRSFEDAYKFACVEIQLEGIPENLTPVLVKQKRTKPDEFTDYSIVIDGIFLENAVVQTQAAYRKIYPDKILRKPSIDDIVEQFLKYASIKRKERVNCYLIYSSDFDLESIVDIGEVEEEDFLMGERSSSVGSNYNLFKLKTQDIVFFKVSDQLERIVNVENVLLVADDFAYVPYLQNLKDKGIEIIVFQNSENSGSRMHHRFKWADIVYPLALAMGLDGHEL